MNRLKRQHFKLLLFQLNDSQKNLLHRTARQHLFQTNNIIDLTQEPEKPAAKVDAKSSF